MTRRRSMPPNPIRSASSVVSTAPSSTRYSALLTCYWRSRRRWTKTIARSRTLTGSTRITDETKGYDFSPIIHFLRFGIPGHTSVARILRWQTRRRRCTVLPTED